MRKLCFTLLFFISFAGLAQKSVTDTTVQPLEEVKVFTALRSERNTLVVPYSVQQTNAAALGVFLPRSTPEALSRMNGVFVQKTNHGGGSPFVRGLTGNQTLILVDGIRLNNSTFRYGPNQYLNTIDPFTIQTIEVAKGTGSVQYGTDAMGGVMHLFTKEPVFATDRKQASAQVLAKYMSGNMEKTARGEAQFSNQNFALLAGITKKDFGDLIGGDTTGKQSPSGYKEWSADLKAKWKLNPETELIMAGQLLQQSHVPVYHKLVLEDFAVNEMDPQQRLLTYARLRRRGRSVFFRQTEITLSYQQGMEGRYSRKNGTNILRKEKDETNTIGLTADFFSAFTRHWTANSGVELYQDKVSSTRADQNIISGMETAKRGLYPDRSRYGNYSLYSLHHIEWNNWVADAGLRINSFAIRISDTTLGDVKILPAALVTNAALLYRINRYQALYVSYSSGYRAPNVDDMGTLGIVDFRYEIPAASLLPEKSRHTEIGYKLQSKKIKATASLYHLHLGNLITRVKMEGQVISGYPVYKKENTEAAYIKGVETDWEWNVQQNWIIAGGLTYTYGQSLSRKEPLRRIPPFHGQLMAAFRKKEWRVTADWQFAGKQNRLAQGDKDDNRIPAGGTPGWHIFNINGVYTHKHLQLYAGLQNLLNKDYRTHGSGINGVGRSFFIAAQLTIR